MADILDFKSGECIERGAPPPTMTEEDAAVFAFYSEYREFAKRQFNLSDRDAAERAYIRTRVEFGGARVDEAIERKRATSNE